jgi:hypothetical protein
MLAKSYEKLEEMEKAHETARPSCWFGDCLLSIA